MTPAEQAALERAHASMVADVRARLVQFAHGLWGSLGDWRDSDIDRFVAQLVPRIEAGKRTVAGLTDAYLRSATGVQAARDAVLAEEALARVRGIDTHEVYRRPAASMRTTLAEGGTFDQALKAGATRLGSLVVTDLQLAKTRQAHRTLSRAKGYDGYRRVVHGDKNCLLCLIASTKLYHRSELLPIHPGCDCGVDVVKNAPAILGMDGQIVVDPDLLERTHNAVEAAGMEADRGARDPDYRKLVVTHEHGELGPVLGLRGQHFTGVDDLTGYLADIT